MISAVFAQSTFTLPQISTYLSGNTTDIPHDDGAKRIARTMIARAAKIAAILTAGAVLRCTGTGEDIEIAVEGSQFAKLTGFRAGFLAELTSLLASRDIRFRMVQFDAACLKGAALAAFAQPM